MSHEPRTSSAAPDDVLLRCDGLVIGHRGVPLLPPLSLDIPRGRFVLVVGCNGAGKSTWLQTVLGLIPPVRGAVRTNAGGAPIQMSYVPQHTRFDEILPVRASTVASWGWLRGWDFLRPWTRASDRRALRGALIDLDAAAFAPEPFRNLSGGQRQRILFARLLVRRVDLALLDEPTASMDISSEKQAYAHLARMIRERNMSVVVVTHTIGAAAAYADHVLFLDRGDDRSADGGVAMFGSPEEVFEHPLFRTHFGDVRHHAR